MQSDYEQAIQLTQRRETESCLQAKTPGSGPSPQETLIDQGSWDCAPLPSHLAAVAPPRREPRSARMEATLQPTAIPAMAPVLRDEDDGSSEADGAAVLVLVEVARVALLVPDSAVRVMRTSKSGSLNPLMGVVSLAPPLALPPMDFLISTGTSYVVRSSWYRAQMASSSFCLPKFMLCTP
ncbi:hypothetical protein HG531_009344 [Fusarium graminearum]|nr:hypothetical protein HG531_009344 [Fusarium graminearum]